jgi:hypothetical protein
MDLPVHTFDGLWDRVSQIRTGAASALNWDAVPPAAEKYPDTSTTTSADWELYTVI